MLEPVIIDGSWRNESEHVSVHHRASFDGSLVEWSLSALGWLAALVADTSFRFGVRGPVVLSVSSKDGEQ
jgi:hypothetical protein